MDRVDSADYVTVAGKRQYTDGSPPLTPATVLASKWLNAVQEELLKVIEDAGLTASGADNTQLRQALNALYGRLAAANTWTDAQVFGSTVQVTGLLTAGNGTGAGLNGVGPGAAATGVLGVGDSAAGTGVVGTGGATGGVGVHGNGGSGAAGVTGTGGSSASGVEGTGGSNGDGVRGTGTGSGFGGRFTGGGSGGAGVSAQGGAGGVGLVATGGTGAEGIHGIGATTNYGVRGSSPSGIGVYGESTSGSTTAAGVSGFSNNTGAGVEGSSAAGPGGKFSRSSTRGSLNLVPAAGDPASPQNGDMWYDSTANAVKLYINGAVKTITVT